MLDHFTILTSGGLVLWSRSFTPSRAPIDSLIRQALIEERTTTTTTTTSNVSRYDIDQTSLLYSFENSLSSSSSNSNSFNLIFVVSFAKILNLNYPHVLLERVRKLFVKNHGNKLEELKIEMKFGKSSSLKSGGFEWNGWEETFDRLLKELELEESLKNKKSKPRTAAALTDTSAEPTPPETPIASISTTTGNNNSSNSTDAETIARNIAALKARQKAANRGSKKRGGGGSGNDTDSNPGSESENPSDKSKRIPPIKSATKWDDSSLSAADLAAYDYSSSSTTSKTSTMTMGNPSSQRVDTNNLVSKEALGKRDERGMYEVAEYHVGATRAGDDDSDQEDDERDDSTTSTVTATTKESTSSSTFSSFFSRLSLSSSSSSSTTGSSSSSKTLTKSDLSPILAQFQSHLISKNVASPIATSLVNSIGLSLEGKSIDQSSFTNWISRGGWNNDNKIRKLVKQSLSQSLTKVLTPQTSTDLLLEITRKRSSSSGGGGEQPYSITFIGVNGVGKSTNLSKVAFWLLQNKFKVLIAACDTFRSGAVEQLRVHVNNLSKLEHQNQEGQGKVELFEKGYGKDAAGIAKEAINYAKLNEFDVVLIDTAGRQQGNEPLMRALAKLVSVNQPDKIIFVGEALVGNEAVDQLTKFDRSLRDFSAAASAGANNQASGGKGVKEGRGIDGMILTKFDTIDDKVGAALSMTYTTGQPIYFVGCGQTYSDLRMLRVGHIVQALLQD